MRPLRLATPFLLVPLLALGLAACSEPATPATDAGAAASDAAPAAPAQQASAADAEQAAQAEAAVSELLAQSGAPLVEGTDYVVIPNGQPFEPVAGKIEIAEAFNHACPACAGFQPLVTAWKKQLPDDVNFVYVPATFRPDFVPFARAVFAAEALGLSDQTHDALYRAIHIDRTVPGEGRPATPEQVARFYQAYGADPTEFAETMGSFAVEGKLKKADQFMQRSGVEGTPTLVVAGKYRVTGGQTRQDQVRIANQLVAMEREAAGTPAPAATESTEATDAAGGNH